MNAPLGRDWLLANLPHQGAMNLLSRIERWNESTLHACAGNHRGTSHPLRRGAQLPSTAGIEYGAQAAAAHGALSANAPSGAGMIAAVRSVKLHAARLDDIEGNLDVLAEQLGSSAAGVLYRFEVASSGGLLVEGRVTVAFRT